MSRSVLFVCTANICRSPVAEELARSHPDAPEGVVFASAGTHALVGNGIHPPFLALLDAAGRPASPFSARQVTEGLIESSDLILTMTLQHRRDVVTASPAAVRRTFTLREFVRLIASTPPPLKAAADTDGDGWIDAALRLRGVATMGLAREDLEIADPYGRSASAQARCFAEIRTAVDALVGSMPSGPGLFTAPA